MKTVKKLSVLIALLFAFAALCACAKELEKDETVIYKSDNVTVRLLDETQENNIVQSIDMMLPSAESIYGENPSIFNGIIKSIRTAEVESEFIDSEWENEITLFDVEVTKVIADKKGALAVKDVVTVGFPYNYRAKISCNIGALPFLREGAELMIISAPSAELASDPNERSGYSDYWVLKPWIMLNEKVGDCYITNEFIATDIDRLAISELIEKAGSGDNVRAIHQGTALKICNERQLNIDGIAFENIRNIIAARLADADGRIDAGNASHIFLVDAELFERSVAAQAAQY